MVHILRNLGDHLELTMTRHQRDCDCEGRLRIYDEKGNAIVEFHGTDSVTLTTRQDMCPDPSAHYRRPSRWARFRRFLSGPRDYEWPEFEAPDV